MKYSIPAGLSLGPQACDQLWDELVHLRTCVAIGVYLSCDHHVKELEVVSFSRLHLLVQLRAETVEGDSLLCTRAPTSLSNCL